MSESYSRLYHRFAREFPEVYADDRAMATWVRLLLLADASWPMSPPLPRSVRSKPLAMLREAGLVEVVGDQYLIRGLDAERNRRRDAARTGAAKRWQSDGNAIASADAMPRRERDETSRDEKKIPPPPAERGRRKTATNPRAKGTAPRQNGTSPRQEEHREKLRAPMRLAAILDAAAKAGRS